MQHRGEKQEGKIHCDCEPPTTIDEIYDAEIWEMFVDFSIKQFSYLSSRKREKEKDYESLPPPHYILVDFIVEWIKL